MTITRQFPFSSGGVTRKLAKCVFPFRYREAIREWQKLRRVCSSTVQSLRIGLFLTAHITTGFPRLIYVRPEGFGTRFAVRPLTSDVAVVLSLFNDEEYGALSGICHEADTVVDLGVNIGASLRLWERWFPNASIIGLEPEIENFTLAKANAKRGVDRGSIALHLAALGVECGTAKLDTSGEPWEYGLSRSSSTEGPITKVVNVPWICQQHSLEWIDIMKCDIEGIERDIFKSCAGWISKIGCLIIETHPPYSLNELMSDIEDAGGHFIEAYSLDAGCGNEVGVFVNRIVGFEGSVLNSQKQRSVDEM